MKLMICRFISIFTFVLMFANFAVAQTASEKGIELYKQGKNKEAVAVLEKASKQKDTKTDAEIWNYLGLAYSKIGDAKKAIKALEKAVDFNPQKVTYQTNLAYIYYLGNRLDKAQETSSKVIAADAQNSAAYYVRGAASILEGKYDQAIDDADKTIGINPDYSLAYILKSDALLSKFGKSALDNKKMSDRLALLEQSKDVLETCLKNCRNNPNTQIQQERLSSVNAFYNYYERRKNINSDGASAVPPTPDPNVTPLIILSKKPAAYTDNARQNGVTGTISLLVLFSSSGKVTNVLVTEGLGYGLTENAVRAASQIKFEPAKDNGTPISVVKMVQYSFTLY